MVEKMSLLNTIGNTPLVKVNGVWVKLEYSNPSGSIKDRMARYIIEKAEKTGKLKKGYHVVEATTGNTGISFAMVCALKGYKCVIVMPKGMSHERKQIMQAFGARVIETHENCVKCAVQKTLSFKKKAFLPRQFENPWNPIEHEKHLGTEILQGVKKIDAFIAGVGTGGTLVGVGKAIRKKFPSAQLIAVEPSECPLLSENKYAKHVLHGLHKGFTCKKHGIEGIGDGFIPKIIEQNRDLIDDVITIKTKDAIRVCNFLAKKGFLVGPSSGANFLGALKLKKKFSNVVTLFPDRGSRYLSEKIFD
ncbi:cysteine synthase family protein [Candidatus Micrarchaeota archaeon]|nr:cysteine synthase family protein [Candidatus Micrarchaeota archaeon]MBU1929943.1 cysteine synthase family protein [Candidatus Micrarchaeota archaeon]